MLRSFLRKIKYNKDLSILYAANFFFSLHFSFVLYINSSFLASRVGEGLVGIFYIISAVLSITLFTFIPKFLKNFGNYRTIMMLSQIELFVLLGIGIIGITPIVVLLFLIHLIVVPLIFFSLDIFLKKSVKKKCDVGSVRGSFLAISSLAFALAPTFVGQIIEKMSFQDVYLISALILVPFIALVSFAFKKFIDPKYNLSSIASIPKSLKRLTKDKNITFILFAHTAYRVFTTWTLIYIPIYLSKHLYFPWSDVGTLLTIMLLPFLLFEFPLGKIADKKIGEKEILIGGFLTIITASVLFSIVTIPSFFIWAVILFIGRTGSTASEVATESYFFKHVHCEDTEVISLFRMLRPLSYIISTLGALIALSFIPFQFMFLALAGLVAALGLPAAFKIEDTK